MYKNKMKQYVKTFESYTGIRNTDLDIIKEYLKDYAFRDIEIDNRPIIYRGMNTILDVYLITTEDHDRKPANSSTGYYNLWIDNADEWKEYPKRSKSIICTNNIKTAKKYGGEDFYYIFPLCKDLSKLNIGVCPNSDMWNSAELYIDTINNKLQEPSEFQISYETEFSGILTFQEEIEQLKKLPVSYFDDMIDSIQKFGDNIQDLDYETIELIEKYNMFLPTYAHESGIHLLDIYKELMNPIENEFLRINSKETILKYMRKKYNNEIWFSHDSIAISRRYFGEIKDELNIINI